MNIFTQLRQEIIEVAKTLCYLNDELLKNVTIEIPKDNFCADISTNVAMIIAAKHKKNPKIVAEEFKNHLIHVGFISNIEVAGHGFLNFTIKSFVWHEELRDILSSKSLKILDVGTGIKVNLEYVSANPTGPMHIGHTRGAIYGDVLAKILTLAGFEVTKEYYINDAGSQIEVLAKSAYLRYKEALTGQETLIPEGLYPGEYLIEVGRKLVAKYSYDLINMPYIEAIEIVKDFAVEQMLQLIKHDLITLGIHHDIFFSEKSLYEQHKIQEVVEFLKAKDLIYQGILPSPKGIGTENWEAGEQLLFRSTNFGDAQDRSVQKSNGEWTYFASDLAYAYDKVRRGFNRLIYVLGADHLGYVKRLEAIIWAVSSGHTHADIKICQLVNFVENGQNIKMSKRAGTFVTASDVIKEFGKDIVRFMMITRKNDIILDFDLQMVREQSKDNPIFYVQYANVRINSIFRKAKENFPDAIKIFESKIFDLSLLDLEEEFEIIKHLASWEKVLEASAIYCEPHRIAFYVINLAAKFHHLWNLSREGNDYRFLVEGNSELTAARLSFAHGIQKMIRSILEIIGVDVIEIM